MTGTLAFARCTNRMTIRPWVTEICADFHQGMVGARLGEDIQSAKYRRTLHLHIEDPAPRLFIIGLCEIEIHLVESIDQGELVLELGSEPQRPLVRS